MLPILYQWPPRFFVVLSPRLNRFGKKRTQPLENRRGSFQKTRKKESFAREADGYITWRNLSCRSRIRNRWENKCRRWSFGVCNCLDRDFVP
jgi:hypothetical protein